MPNSLAQCVRGKLKVGVFVCGEKGLGLIHRTARSAGARGRGLLQNDDPTCTSSQYPVQYFVLNGSLGGGEPHHVLLLDTIYSYSNIVLIQQVLLSLNRSIQLQ